ncbi:hypothetical protein [Nocardia flavorosea]|uniref:Uncharacterized protein n=1 Tax=Nocardia flavorosea TaxID=53429 RepID=A0A846YNM9_9NOCA|nr:hypothetical protein [Nocardia flavorosea]NKY60383.1 hypothetical protein [Nocardia flavorosea]
MEPIENARRIAKLLHLRSGFGQPSTFEVQGAQLNALIAIHDAIQGFAGIQSPDYSSGLIPDSERQEIAGAVEFLTGAAREGEPGGPDCD